jgi:integral membrane protein (TIGR01906 family)
VLTNKQRRLPLLIAVCVPLVILGNALIVLLLPWMPDLQYALPGFPADEFGLERAERADLAETGIRSIWPVGRGTDLLSEARLPDGGEAFRESEISHMDDVRALVRGVLIAWLVAVAGLVATLARSWNRAGGPGRAGWTGLRWGGMATLGLFGAVGLLMLVGFDAVFDGFHGIFFEGDSWKFDDDFTLRRLYPDAFWGIAAAWLVILVLAQALGLLLWSRAGGRDRGRNGPEPPQASQ